MCLFQERQKKCARDTKLYLAPSAFCGQPLGANDPIGLGPLLDKTNSQIPPFSGGFRRVGEIWVAAEEHAGLVKRSSRAGLDWKERGNRSVASARDAKTGISRFGDHSGALPVRRGRLIPLDSGY